MFKKLAGKRLPGPSYASTSNANALSDDGGRIGNFVGYLPVRIPRIAVPVSGFKFDKHFDKGPQVPLPTRGKPCLVGDVPRLIQS